MNPQELLEQTPDRHKNQCECGAFWCLTDHTYENNLRAFDPES